MNIEQLKNILESILLVSADPVSLDQFKKIFASQAAEPTAAELREALNQLADDYIGRAMELVETASGYRIQVRQDYAPWVTQLWEEKPARYSRALLETLALIAYRQPITRAQIEEIRGVAVSTTIIKTLMDRGWVKIVGHRDVPGKPALYATSKQFLDDFNLQTLSQLPSLQEIIDLESVEEKLSVQLELASIAAPEETINATTVEAVAVEELS